MLTSEFDFTLPNELIAQHPVKPRDASRMMVVDRKTGTIAHRHFDEFPEILDSGDLLVRNNSQVLPARLIGRRTATQGKWEGLFLDNRPDGSWEILAKTRGRPVAGETVIVGEGLHLVLEARGADGRWIVRPILENEPEAGTLTLLYRHGRPPLPPYIRGGIAEADDETTYQTVYARRPGSVAAPTAGLHFTGAVFARLEARGVQTLDVTLHVGVGTFRPIEATTLEAHTMHTEWAELDAETATALRHQHAQGGRIVAVGTTSARTLETAAASGDFEPFQGRADLFIRPGHTFHAVDVLLTNFHLPRSSLLVLVSSLGRLDLVRRAYAEAVRERYRFYSYGDAMLIIT